DVRGRVAEDPFGTRVEVGDVPVAVGRNDRVVRGHGEGAEPLLAPTQRLLGPLPLGEIARHLRETEQRPTVIAYGGDHHVRPEAGAVFANAPVLLLVAPLGGGDLQGVLRFTGGEVFRCVKA